MNSKKGQYGHDLEQLQKYYSTIELVAGSSRVVLVPELQGRVMTSSTLGAEGFSFGWINHELLGTTQLSEQFNPFGGEERFWIGPEGGQFSFYFEMGKAMEMHNWRVPEAIDTMPWEVIEANQETATFQKAFRLKNYSGTNFHMEATRRVSIIDPIEIEEYLPIKMDESVRVVAYESLNQLKNTGASDWTKETGAPSIWMLSMYQPSPEVTIVIPFRKEGEGPVLTDDYFGKVPSDRLKVDDGVIFFKADGKFRSKIGVSPQRALPTLGSYDAQNKCLTILICSLDSASTDFVNSSWNEFQKEPFKGDAINAYNDGPLADGGQLGPFYELESSSSAAVLKAGEVKMHFQQTFHFEGDETSLNAIAEKLLGVSINQIKSNL
ncbi:DUF6786 family protein [Sunxiuqinia dokdonensis]|uniref:Uncharacterized protein n=1 Tax=Sunxiuqinia dokdonensis TaxID=1409788 RepID=A0A0L8VA23_9BACT|nr:DUF6786 family protein [Sunxiuqinia dokdonensis]KOH45325.1 hypothetical protein NC99_18430 [Sunxiuqinia dokdonensis]